MIKLKVMLLGILVATVCQAADVELLQSTIVDNNALNFSSAAATFNRNINGRTFQRFPMATFKGYQYATYYDDNRNVCVGRRKLPSGAWEVIRFTDYSITSSDAHNVTAIGICEKDGTIHLAFDHHKDPLNYRVSVLDAATYPESVTWSTDLFSPVTSSLGSVGSIVDFTYPTFFNAPNGNLMLYYRFGGSGNGDGMIQEYNGTTHDWTTGLGKFIARTGTYFGTFTPSSSSRCPYINGISYAGTRLHASWGWRETTSSLSNHDLCYAYSDDDGRTWYNSAGTLIGTTGASYITVNSPGLVVAAIPQDTDLSNQYTHYAFADGSCHVMVYHENGSGTRRYHHYWRNAAGVWSSAALSFDGSRPKLTGDDDGNLFLAYVSGGKPRIAKGVPDAGHTAWTWSSVYTQNVSEGGEGQLDYTRWEKERVLTFYGQEQPATTAEVPSPLHIYDYKVSEKASEPDPAHESLNVSTNTSLAWATGINADTHRVYLGTNSSDIATATTNSPEYMGEQGTASYTPAGPLTPGITYYWRIDEIETGGDVHQGLVWCFMTEMAIPPTVYQDVDLGEWNTAATWDPDHLPKMGHDYVSTLRLNVNDASSTFWGDSLTMDPGGSLRLRDSANTFLVNNLIMNGGNIYAGTGNNITFALDGNISVLADSEIQGYWNATGPRDIRILSKVSGAADLTSLASDNNSTHTLSIENTDNDFSGTWICQNGNLAFTSAGAVGAADIEVLDYGKLAISGNWSGNASLTVADTATASVDFGAYGWVVTNLVFGSSPIAVGQYTAAQLNAFGVNTVFTGSGTITVSGGTLTTEMIAGWDTWNSVSAPGASHTAGNVTASATASTDGGTSNWNNTDSGADPGRGSSDDATWGTYNGNGSAPSTVTTIGVANFTAPNGVTDAQITFTINNTGSQNIVLTQFHFDAVAFRPNAPRTYAINVLAGSDITVGNVFTSANDAITELGGALSGHDQHDDIDLSLTGLADNTLEAGGTAIIQLAFSDGTGSGGGHHLFVDNVGISGQTVSDPPPVLEIGMSGSDVELTWAGTGYKLQTDTSLTNNAWSDVPGGTASPVLVPPTNPASFFRLIEQ